MDPKIRPSLRGPTARNINGRVWFITGALLLAVFAALVCVSFISATNDNARIDRMKNHGISVEVTVTSCVGNIGGSGSNAAGYTCHGSYRVHGRRYQEVIGSDTSPSSAGTKVRALADPARPSTIDLASAIRASSASLSVYVVPSLLALCFVVLMLLYIRRRRASTSRSPKPASA